jgi:hypothetical protein
LTIIHGSTGTATFTLTPTNGYAGTITLACGTLPANASCSFAPAQIVFTSALQTAQNTVLTIDTTSHSTALNRMPGAAGYRLAMIGLPFSMVCLLGMRRRAVRLPGLSLTLLLCAFGLLLGTGGMLGCAGSPAAAPTTPTGNYTVPITITDGSTNHSISYSITVN